jgi:hypothetical protein
MHLGVHMVLATLQMHRRSQQGTTMATWVRDQRVKMFSALQLKENPDQ